MAKSKKNTEKAVVKIQDMAPANDPKGGDAAATLSPGIATQIAKLRNDMLKGIVQNIRA